MPFERSPDGLIKHIINEKMDTKECCLDIYMQFLPPGKASGKHRHLSEEVIYVVEGKGYDLHWDVKFDVHETMEFEWEAEPKRYDWEQGDFIYIPPYCIHKHFNADPANEARIIVINSRSSSRSASTGSSSSRTRKDIDSSLLFRNGNLEPEPSLRPGTLLSVMMDPGLPPVGVPGLTADGARHVRRYGRRRERA